MKVKFIKPMSVEQAFENFCNHQASCRGCPLDDKGNSWNECRDWVINHPSEAAKIMELELVREKEDKKETEEEQTMSRPKICEILGVEVGEKFRIQGSDETVFQILNDGTFATQPVNVPGSTTALLQAIEHPERVVCLSRWSPDEVALARAFWEACYSMDDVFFYRRSNGRLCWGVDSEGMDLSENHLPVCLFPQIKNGHKIYLRDIVS